jgi:DNA-binding transcriptional MerR regulator
MSGRAYLSIGDVLTLLRQEFPDVTISKIRFLESQGLVNPERTPSGYRKFYEPDVERLRWVLRQQREHFLPLKVIKGRLEEVGEKQGNGRSQERAARSPSSTHASGTARGAASATGAPLPGLGSAGVTERASSARAAVAERPRSRGAAAPAGEPAGTAAATTRTTEGDEDEDVQDAARRAGAASRTAGAGARRAKASAPPPVVLAEGEMTADELMAASGCPATALAALQSYGLLSCRQLGGVDYYGEDALSVARLAAGFAGYGVEARHLRLHKHAADREAGFIEQVVLPLLKQRNPESRQRAHDTVEELSRLGQELRAVLLARTLRDQLGG